MCPLLHKLLEVYFKPEESYNITRLEKTMKTSIRTNLSHRYTGSILMLHNVAAFMDPWFKTLSFLSDESRLNVIASVEAEVVMLAIKTSTVHESESATSTEVETTEQPDLPLAKKCQVSKAEKCLLCFVDDIVKSKIRWLILLRRPELKSESIQTKKYHMKHHCIGGR